MQAAITESVLGKEKKNNIRWKGLKKKKTTENKLVSSLQNAHASKMYFIKNVYACFCACVYVMFSTTSDKKPEDRTGTRMLRVPFTGAWHA